MTKISTTSPDILRDARQLYNTHRESATKPTKVENLDKLWEALLAIKEEGGRDYSLAEVGRRLEHLGGPKTQSLRNSQGAAYREIIAAFANAVEGSTRYVAKTKTNVEQALELITDPSVRATIRVALDEAKRLKVVNDNLHAAFKSLQIATVKQDPLLQLDEHQTNPVTSTINLSPQHLNALSKGIEPSRLAQQGLHIGEDGSISNDQGDKLFPPAFIFAVRSLIGK